MADIRFRAFALAATAALFGTLGSLACSKSTDSSDETFRTADPETQFRALQDDLVSTCGGANGSCHVRGTQAPRWLADPDPYVSAKGYRGILPITRDSSDSILLTQVDHVGPSLQRYPKLYDRVANWIQSELPKPALPATGKFSVTDGFNVVELGPVADGLLGARLTFVATQVNNVLSLSAIRIQAPNTANLAVKAPFFVVHPRSGKVSADPTNGWPNQEMTVPAGTTQDLFTGKMVILRWDQAGQLKLVFSDLTTTPGQGASQGCTALDVFKSKAIPAMSTQTDVYDDPSDGGAPGSIVTKGSCLGCHAKEPAPGDAPEPPVQAMDLRGYDTDPAAACAQARARIDFTDKTKSAILLNPQGKGNPAHPMRGLAESDPIIQGINAWVQAEQR